MTILDELADYARVRVANNKNILSFSELRKRVNEIDIGNFEFEQQLKKDDISLIIIICLKETRPIYLTLLPVILIGKGRQLNHIENIWIWNHPRLIMTMAAVGK